jgi:flavin-dependent dehydrogenase
VNDVDAPSFDVAICGGGLAGLSLARQLRLELPDISVVLLDRHVAPLPEATWKVGESTVEFGSHYLADQLRLRSNLDERHLRKLGLRFFFPGGDNFETRPEFGLRQFASLPTYQIDRGILENDLRAIVHGDGVCLIEGARVTKLEINAGETAHRINFVELAQDKQRTLTCRWLVDASGRRQLIQRQLDLRKQAAGHPCSAAWFRVPGRVDVEDLPSGRNESWVSRVPGKIRYLSTNHLCGPGYWVWLIPLSSDNTSVGIVARSDMHEFEAFNSPDRARNWLAGNEPDLARLTAGAKMLDFKAIRNYSYSSARVYSEDRWACVGEAAFFSDPFYSPGTDLIAVANTQVSDLIARDRSDRLSAGKISEYSSAIIGLNDELTQSIQDGYAYLGDEIVSLARSVWDIAAAWGHLCPQIYNRTYIDEPLQAAMRGAGAPPVFLLSTKLRSLLAEWLRLRSEHGGRLTYHFFDYLDQSWLSELRQASLRKFDSAGDFAEQYKANKLLLEELVMALYLLAIDDLYPDMLERLKQVPSFNIRKLTLDPKAWQSMAPNAAGSERRNFRRIYDEIRIHLSSAHISD